MSGTAHLAWAISARGLDPAAKVVLIIAANGADMDGRSFEPFTGLEELCNLTPEGFRAAVERLTEAGFACFTFAESLDTGQRARCLQLIGGDDGR